MSVTNRVTPSNAQRKTHENFKGKGRIIKIKWFIVSMMVQFTRTTLFFVFSPAHKAPKKGKGKQENTGNPFSHISTNTLPASNVQHPTLQDCLMQNSKIYTAHFPNLTELFNFILPMQPGKPTVIWKSGVPHDDVLCNMCEFK